MGLSVPIPSGQANSKPLEPAAADPVAMASPPAPTPAGLSALHAVVTTPAPAPTPPPVSAAQARREARQARNRARKWRDRKRYEIPSWTVSLAVHVLILGTLAVATVTPEVRQAVASIDSALVDTRGTTEELTPLYSDPTATVRDQAVGDPNATSPGPLGGDALGTGVGSGPPSATPRVGLAGPVSERSVLPASKSHPVSLPWR